MGSNDDIFEQDGAFWDTYNIGRPAVPDSLFEKIFNYHAEHSGNFRVVHDIGAGNGPYAQRLRSKFKHVIVSDIVATNVELAQKRLRGLDGYSFRVAALEDSEGIETGGVSMIFATNVMHFADPQDSAMRGLARQLEPGGTLVVAAFAPAHFYDERLQDVWKQIGIQGGRTLLGTAEDRDSTLRALARTEKYNLAPLDPDLWEPGALRMSINIDEDGIQAMVPPEDAKELSEPDCAGPTDVSMSLEDPEWEFEMSPDGVRAHMQSFPFVSRFAEAQASRLAQVEEILKDGQSVKGRFPVKLILASLRK